MWRNNQQIGYQSDSNVLSKGMEYRCHAYVYDVGSKCIQLVKSLKNAWLGVIFLSDLW